MRKSDGMGVARYRLDMKTVGWTGLIFFIFLNSSFAQEVLLSKDREYNFMRYEYDRNGDGKADHRKTLTYDGRMLKDTYDNNFDGDYDYHENHMRIHHVIEISKDLNFDDHDDVRKFIFPDKEYVFNDKNSDGTLDQLVILDLENAKQILCSEPIQEEDMLLMDLYSFLKTKSSKCGHFSEDVSYQLGQEYKGLNKLLQSATDDPFNQNKWEVLFNKTREVLDLPSQDVLPIKLKIKKSKEEMEFNRAAAASISNEIIFYPLTFKDNLSGWLEAIDHELLHILQHKWIFETVQFFLTKQYPTDRSLSEVTWGSFSAELMAVLGMPLEEGKKKLESKSKCYLQTFNYLSDDLYRMFFEAEAYFYGGIRQEYYMAMPSRDTVSENFFVNLISSDAHVKLAQEAVQKYNEKTIEKISPYYSKFIIEEILSAKEAIIDQSDEDEWESEVQKKVEDFRREFSIVSQPKK